MATTDRPAPHLDARLLTAAHLVRPGSVAADVGCDHGRLAAWLACTGRCPRVMASDLRPAPLATARETCRAFACEDRVDCRLAAGLEGLEPGQVQDIVVAGLSAETMIEVFEAAPWVFAPGMRLVLVPATRHEVLRRWLARRGFALAADIPVQCAGRWYAVIAADYTGKGREPEETWCQLGDTGRHPGGEGYKADRLIRWRKRLRGMPDEEERARQLAMIEQLEG
ncbi:MAG TPA: class I SAM-dependent methyltransferase [Candidatus Gemmiger avium]|nr:class I SAM-dependent methyltransferase [Candidatus Gemmiger avium]